MTADITKYLLSVKEIFVTSCDFIQNLDLNQVNLKINNDNIK
ncbi:hypothetical protein CAMRE0001_1923 [Campylobacter rectus RM3267]|uniref:Uncharacterized protein n=1 Tax=Campylobacter rectus RM3267 TaxID=553218 RepID=B9CYT6_CAMRE|nr:hypothetical protein CAMRE0001_1923 [Campylobacter rectus RM3267]